MVIDTPETQPHVISEVEITPKNETRAEINSTHNYNTRSSTKRVNNVINFKNAPKMFKMDAIEKKTHTHT